MQRTSVINGCTRALRVASNRHRRRILRHPARLRRQAREQAETDVETVAVVEELKYAPTYEPEMVSANGWSPAPEHPLPGLPFHVQRTPKGLQIPVYRDYRAGGNKVMTLIRRFQGDKAELASEMSKICGSKPAMIRPGRIEVDGDHVTNVRKWLVGLGF